MGTDDLAAGAFAGSVVFPRCFDDLVDPRQRGKVKDPLNEILLLCLLAVLAGADCIADIARFGEKKRDIHMVSAFASRRRLVLGPVKVADSRSPSPPSRSSWR